MSQQLPAFSPLSRAALAQSTSSLLHGGPFAHQELQELICGRFAADHVILFDSGRSALQMAIGLAGTQVTPLDALRVALPAFQCFEVASAAVGSRARICFYDIDPHT